ncbi:chlorophyllase [Pseudonocardia tropica]|uniref:Chlorophyllase n=1 Tax=Pseudonocardia tropica TaxID=681289 RepID=A0ABV1K0P7_9PSEU
MPAPTAPVVSVAPVTLPVRGRRPDLRLRVSAPAGGTGPAPVLLFAHGFGSSLHAYGPLTDHWAAHGFVVLQPEFLDSRTVGLAPDDPRRPDLWRHRVRDAVRVLDGLDEIEQAVPEVRGRLDRDRVVAAGHSFGGQTAGILLGLRVLDPRTGEPAEPPVDLPGPQVRAGVLLATAGRGGDALAPGVIEQLPWLDVDFSAMRSPALVVMGDADSSPLTTVGPGWSADPYRLAPPGKSLLTLYGAEHSLGGIPGYDAAETTDADPGRVAAVQTLGTAYLHSALDPADDSWTRAAAEFAGSPVGRIESR